MASSSSDVSMLEPYYAKQGVLGQYEVFRSRGFSTQANSGLVASDNRAMEDLPPFLRTLLVADGTVTKSLEAYYWEPVNVQALWQEPITAERAIPWLEVRPGEEVIGRRVDLRGERSNTVYAHASSVIRPEHIPAELRDRLRGGKLGIGELIRDCGLETYRELLEMGVHHAKEGEQIYRTYRIVLHQKPTILVTEHFPLDVFKARP